MKLYLDENIPVVLCTGLAAHGVDSLTTQQAGNLGLSDVQQLAFATTEGRALVTFNRKDFLSRSAVARIQPHTRGAHPLKRITRPRIVAPLPPISPPASNR